ILATDQNRRRSCNRHAETGRGAVPGLRARALAFAMLVSRLFGWTLAAPPVKEAAALAKRAAQLDDSDPWAHLALGYVAWMMARTDDAKQEYQRAIDLNPNFAAAYGYLGWALAAAGRTDEAIALSEQAIRMSPHDPQNAIFNNALAVA